MLLLVPFIDQIPTLSNDKIITHYSQWISRACIDMICVLYVANDNVRIIILFYHSQHTITIWPLSVISKRNHKLIIVLFKRNHINKKTNNKWQWIQMGIKESKICKKKAKQYQLKSIHSEIYMIQKKNVVSLMRMRIITHDDLWWFSVEHVINCVPTLTYPNEKINGKQKYRESGKYLQNAECVKFSVDSHTDCR